MAKVLVLYYSAYGHIEAMANAVAEGARKAGALVDVKRVPELVPADVAVTITRDYGTTANDKASELLFHLGLATVSIVVLIALAIGWREGIVTLAVIPTTILMTIKLRPIYEDFRRWTAEELDYRVEARYAARLRENGAAYDDEIIPRVVPECTTKRVLSGSSPHSGAASS